MHPANSLDPNTHQARIVRKSNSCNTSPEVVDKAASESGVKHASCLHRVGDRNFGCIAPTVVVCDRVGRRPSHIYCFDIDDLRHPRADFADLLDWVAATCPVGAAPAVGLVVDVVVDPAAAPDDVGLAAAAADPVAASVLGVAGLAAGAAVDAVAASVLGVAGLAAGAAVDPVAASVLGVAGLAAGVAVDPVAVSAPGGVGPAACHRLVGLGFVHANPVCDRLDYLVLQIAGCRSRYVETLKLPCCQEAITQMWQR